MNPLSQQPQTPQPDQSNLSSKQHPCLSCGACCAFFRVSFHWREGADAQGGGAPLADDAPLASGVPLETCSDLNSTLRVMNGTMQRGGRCEQLDGTLGERVACRIYGQRPTPCRDFTASYENGQQHPDCDRARAAHGMAALQPSDWLDVVLVQDKR